MKLRTWILAGFALAFAGCTEVDGQCWRRSDDVPGSGVGGGPIGPGWGGYGDVDPQPQDAADQPPPGCLSTGLYSPSLFKFVTIVADNGVSEPGGWQEAVATISVVDTRQDPTVELTCNMTVGMGLRTTLRGVISASSAASMTAVVLSQAASDTVHSRPSWIRALYCPALATQMLKLFGEAYAGTGVRISAK